MSRMSKCAEIVEFWGPMMPTKTMEEAGEFTQAVSKLECFLHGPSYKAQKSEEELRQALIDEIGDMYINLMCIQGYYDLSTHDIDERIEYKLNKEY